MNDKMREEFEERYPLPDTCEGFNGGFYFRTDPRSGKELRHPHQEKWRIWQASRETLVMELPPVPAEPEEPEFAIDDSHMDAYHAARRMRDGCVKAIEARGLKVKA